MDTLELKSIKRQLTTLNELVRAAREDVVKQRASTDSAMKRMDSLMKDSIETAELLKKSLATLIVRIGLLEKSKEKEVKKDENKGS